MIELKVRQLSEMDEFAAVVELQKEIWGYAELELLPMRFFVVANKIGGQVLGAYDGARLVAFCICIPGLKQNGKKYLHSHMLGVLSEYRNSGIGRLLKLEQRRYAIEVGVDLIEWTFDPLELKNAFFNIERLGAIVRRYVNNQYGTTSSHLHGGLPTDRLVPEWWVASTRVNAIAAGNMPPSREVEKRIVIPTAIFEWKQKDPQRARELQKRVEAEFTEYFHHDLAVIGFEKTNENGTYLLGKWNLK